ncbi:MFS transporter [Iodobacter sp. HSC-16F04]|uniref:MFS transporter n=1 Tax=Iodobacter violaceini TaxID=3044271 RepID=A0ABX0KR36_9NEIS|nr:MFS transporter [Iodobacter violacea]NHQ84522.1 MFS transporter [Iodobacter violacea]
METSLAVGMNRSRNICLAVLSLAQFMIALDYSIVYVALPEIARHLQMDQSLAQWLVSSYGLMFAGFLLVGGRLCDRFGAAVVFIRAMALFAAASLLGGFALSGVFLLLARGVQGIAAAALQPAIIALIALSFAEGAERARALSVWGAVGASGLVAGVVLGGVLATLSWPLIFLINVPVALVCLLAANRVFPAALPSLFSGRIPLFASALGTAAVLGGVLLLTVIAEFGYQHFSIPYLLLGSVGLLLAFYATEVRSAAPLISPVLWAIPNLKIGCMASALYMAGVGTEFYMVTLLLQEVYGYDVLSTGLLFLPLSLTIILGNILAGRWIGRLAAKHVLAYGFFLGAAGLLLLALSTHVNDYWRYTFPALVMSGLGHGLIYTSKFAVGIEGVSETQQGSASALMVTAQYSSGAMALALLVIILKGLPVHQAYPACFGLLVMFSLLGMVVALKSARMV